MGLTYPAPVPRSPEPQPQRVLRSSLHPPQTSAVLRSTPGECLCPRQCTHLILRVVAIHSPASVQIDPWSVNAVKWFECAGEAQFGGPNRFGCENIALDAQSSAVQEEVWEEPFPVGVASQDTQYPFSRGQLRPRRWDSEYVVRSMGVERSSRWSSSYHFRIGGSFRQLCSGRGG